MTVLPLLDLNELLRPIHVGVAEQVVDVLRSAPGFVSVGDVIGKDGERGDDVGEDQSCPNPCPAPAVCGQGNHATAGQNGRKYIDRQDVAGADVHSRQDGDSQVNSRGQQDEGQLAALA